LTTEANNHCAVMSTPPPLC